MQPLANRVLLRSLTPDHVVNTTRAELARPGHRTQGGLHLPDQSVDVHQRHMQGEVIAVGPDCDPAILPGLRVIVQRWSQVPIDDSGEVWVTWDDAVIALLVED